jgi:enamine deaminase RidA (YjgF/YER057c/UK114 family)
MRNRRPQQHRLSGWANCRRFKTKILQVTIYVADMADYDAMNLAWGEWVPQGHTPARATVQARLADPRYKVEMTVIAAL